MNQAINDCLAGWNSIGKAFCGYAASAFIQSALLVILLLAIDLLLHKRVRAVFRYGVWLLVLVKLLLPPTLSLPTGIGYWVGNRLSTASPMSEPVPSATEYEPVKPLRYAGPEPLGRTPQDYSPSNMPETGTPFLPVALSWTPVTWQAVVLLLWLGGVLAFAALLAQRLRFVRGLVAASTPAGGDLLGLLEECRRQMGVRWPVGLRMSDTVPSPAVCGLWRPMILMPTTLVEKLSPEGLRAALIHELAHVKRADLWINAVQTFLQVVYFYNPFVWLANTIIRRTCEEAVDETVLVTLGGQAKNYSNTLIDISEMAFWKADFGLRLIGVAESRKALQGRIKHMLTRPIPKSARIGGLGTIVILIVAAVLLPMARAERTSQDPSVAPSPTATETTQKATGTGATDTVEDPKTGLKFAVTRTISGANDVIEHESWTTLSPNGKFLFWVWEGRIVPLDGSPAFALKELQGPGADKWSATWSPDGQKIAYFAEGIEVLPVSPNTGRPAGPARRLLEEKGGWSRGRIYWSADSERILFVKKRGETEGEARSITLRDGRVNKQPDYADFGLVSPDGKTMAYAMPDGLWTRPVSGAPRIARARSGGWTEDAQVWTSDSQWVVSVLDGWGWKNVHFTRLSDGRNFDLFPPAAVGTFIGKSTDGKKLYFYRSSFDEAPTTFKVVPISGGPVSSMKTSGSWEETWTHSWTSDSAALAALSYGWFGRQQELWLIPVDGGDRVQFNMESLGKEKAWLWRLSPDSRRLLYGVRRGTDQGIQSVDLYVVPISLKDGRATGPATLVFEGLKSSHPEVCLYVLAWSPDASRIALPLWDGNRIALWILSADGGKPVQIDGEVGWPPAWSPDSKTIAFGLQAPDRQMLRVIPAEGGTARTVLTTPKEQPVAFAWAPDSRALVAAYEGTITSVPVAGGTGRAIVRLADAGYEGVLWLRWSPNGQHLAFEAWKRNEASRMCVFSPDTGRVTTLDNSPEGARDFIWSPDSKMICGAVREPVKARPAGVIRELDVTEAVQKAPPVAEKKPAENKPAARAEPVVGPVFSDNFDNGVSKHWRFQDLPENGLGPGRHVVEDGVLMLSHSRAILDVPDWTDYTVTVRVCLKEAVASGDANIGIEARAVPSQLGSSRMDRYGLGLFGNSSSSPYLCMGINYADASDILRHGILGRCPCGIVKDKWYTLEFEVQGQRLRGYLDGKLMIEATDARLSKGILWIGASRSRALFDDFSVRQLP